MNEPNLTPNPQNTEKVTAQYMPGSVPAYVPAAPFKAGWVEVGAALFSYVLAYLYVVFVFEFPPAHIPLAKSVGMSIFVLAYIVCVALFNRGMGHKKVPAESWFWLAALVCVAVQAAWLSSRTLQGYTGLALHGLAAYWLLCRAGALLDGKTGSLVPLDAARAMIILPFGNFLLRIRTLIWGASNRKKREHKTNWGSIGIAVLVLGCAAIALMYAASLLMQADGGFEQLLYNMTDWVNWNWSIDWDIFWRLVVSLPVGCYLYGLTGGALRKKQDGKAGRDWHLRLGKLRLAPTAVVAASLALFCALYALFFAVQGSYLFSAFSGQLPAGFTASEYARRGFFELCRILLLNFAVLGALALVCKKPLRQSAVVRGFGLALCVCSLLLAVVAASKMGLYIRLYGLTPRRVLASWGILVLTVWTILAAVWLVRGIPVVRWAVFVATGAFALLCVSNPDALIYKGNLALYASGVTETLDVDLMGNSLNYGNTEQLFHDLNAAGWLEPGRSADELEGLSGSIYRQEDKALLWMLDEKDYTGPCCVALLQEGKVTDVQFFDSREAGEQLVDSQENAHA